MCFALLVSGNRSNCDSNLFLGANSWLNVVIARELHTMLKHSNKRRRYYPPTLRRVVLHASIVYLGSAILGVLEYVPGIPMESAPQFGSACLPLQYDLASTVFFYVVFLPLLALIPILLVAYYAFDVWRSSILPTTGKGRNLAVYFARVIVCFAIMWLPAVVLIFMAGGNVSPWVSHSGWHRSMLYTFLRNKSHYSSLLFLGSMGWRIVESLAGGRFGSRGSHEARHL